MKVNDGNGTDICGVTVFQTSRAPFLHMNGKVDMLLVPEPSEHELSLAADAPARAIIDRLRFPSGQDAVERAGLGRIFPHEVEWIGF